MSTLASNRPVGGQTDVPLLEINGISCNYGLERAVYGLDLTVNKGEQVCLLGPSGCGKTTVLRAIAGFQPLISGSISINDQRISQPGEMMVPEKRRVGMVFQDHALFPHLTVQQNIASGLRTLSTAQRKATVSEMLERVGLESVARRYPHELSGGQQQRVGIARALAQEPSIMLADEPVASLDPAISEEILDLLSEIQKQGITMVVSLHQVDYARRYAERIIGLNDGRVVFDGTPEALSDAVLQTIYGR